MAAVRYMCFVNSGRTLFSKASVIGTAVCIGLPMPIQPSAKRSLSTTSVVRSEAGKHWKLERVAAISLLGLIPAGMVYPSAVVDYGLAFLIPLHGHWGFNSVIEDYFPKVLKRPANWLLYLFSFGVFGGLMLLNLTDVGICNAVKMVWSL